MLEWLKSAWSSWKVKVAVVGGALVVATTYGTCTVEPASVSDATTTASQPTTAGETVPVSSTTEATTETTTGTTTTEATTGTTTETE